jgi:hypothetical protein
MSAIAVKKEKATIHKIRELQLKQIILDEDYDVLKEIGSGDYGKVMLAQHRMTNTQV